MEYTIKIEDSSPIAKSIINMLKELAKEHPFLDISFSVSEVQNTIVEELEARYKFVMENPEEGDSWEDVKKRLLSK